MERPTLSASQNFNIEVDKLPWNWNYRISRSWLADKLINVVPDQFPESVDLCIFPLRNIGIIERIIGLNAWSKVIETTNKAGIEICPQLTAPTFSLENSEVIKNIIKGDAHIRVLSIPIVEPLDYKPRSFIFALCVYDGFFELRSNQVNYAEDQWDPDSLILARKKPHK